MNANVTISQVYWNKGLYNFFFRDQALKEFEKLVQDSEDPEELFENIEELFENIEDFEEFLYNENYEYIKEYLFNE